MRQFWASYSEQVNQKIKNYFPKTDDLLKQAMLYSLNAGGKRLRPVLAGASAFALGQDPEAVLDFAMALEFIHTYSLIHDDLPGMDDADLRRGLPTNHKEFGEGIAILAGDALLTEAFKILSLLKFPPHCVVKCIELISHAAGQQGMCGGQLLDLTILDTKQGVESIIEVAEKKTAALIQASVLGPAILFEADKKSLEAFTAFGYHIGVCFQMVDDLLDLTGNSDMTGKDHGLDKKDGKFTFVDNLGLEETQKYILKYKDISLASLEKFNERARLLKEIAAFICERDK